MGRLLAAIGALVGLLLVPLALAAPTSALLIPAHLVFSTLVVMGSVVEGYGGHPARARIWGIGYLVASIAMVVGLQLGSDIRHSGYWWLPWSAALVWGWIPPVVAAVFGWVGRQRRRRLVRRAVLRRKRAARS